MKSEQITAIAREYAEEEIATELPNITDYAKERTISAVAERTENVIRFLLQRYYLADKEKAKAFYNGDTFGELDFLEVVSCRRVLESLFPEIAKEVE